MVLLPLRGGKYGGSGAALASDCRAANRANKNPPGHTWPGGFSRRRAGLVHQAVELRRVLAGDLVDYLGRQSGELLVDVLGGFRPDAVGMRVVRPPHHVSAPVTFDHLS